LTKLERDRARRKRQREAKAAAALIAAGGTHVSGDGEPVVAGTANRAADTVIATTKKRTSGGQKKPRGRPSGTGTRPGAVMTSEPVHEPLHAGYNQAQSFGIGLPEFLFRATPWDGQELLETYENRILSNVQEAIGGYIRYAASMRRAQANYH